MRYPPPAGELLRATSALAAALPHAAPQVLLDEVPYYLSFLTDATAHQDDTQLLICLRWSDDYHTAAVPEREQLLQLLGTLAEAITATKHPDAALLLSRAVATLARDQAC